MQLGSSTSRYRLIHSLVVQLLIVIALGRETAGSLSGHSWCNNSHPKALPLNTVKLRLRFCSNFSIYVEEVSTRLRFQLRTFGITQRFSSGHEEKDVTRVKTKDGIHGKNQLVIVHFACGRYAGWKTVCFLPRAQNGVQPCEACFIFLIVQL